jgi:dTDP-4-dehydrorhamnose 3,5-epimerase
VIERLSLPEVWSFTPRRFEDDRGWLSETYSVATLAEALNGVSFVQENQSFSRKAGTLRGMHFQTPPRAQDKLVRAVRGSVLDVAVDLRRNSATRGKWVSAILSAEQGNQLFVPKGFAHGFLTLEPETEVLYKISDYYSREHERGVAWDDPAIGVEWGVAANDITIADRDRAFPRLADLPDFF